jgi:hypothetical protein
VNALNSPFSAAKVGDWIIDDNLRCHQITDIEDGEFGGVRVGKRLKFSWDGIHIKHHGEVETARMATSAEVAAWQEQLLAEAAGSNKRYNAEMAAERVRAAAPQLLEACRRAEGAIRMALQHAPAGSQLQAALLRDLDFTRAAIAAADPVKALDRT